MSPVGEGMPRQRRLVASKLRAPTWRGALIARPQLLAALEGVLTRKLALIHGPAGFGKTTLATQWADQLRVRRIGVAWLSLDAADNDLNRFLAYLLEAVRAFDGGVGSSLRGLIEANPDSSADYVLDTLLADLALQDGESVLFIDDWHLIHDAAVQSSVQHLLMHLPPNLHVVITSRTRGGVPLSRLRVHDLLVEIDSTALRFDLEESRTFLSQHESISLSTEDQSSLWRTTEGWAAALHLASISLRASGNADGIAQWTAGAAANDIGEYLAENVVGRLPPEQVAFLCRTSILERMCGELCNAVTGAHDGVAQLEALESQELFLQPIGEERKWFRYHHLFACFLQRRLERDFPGETADLHRSAARWLSDQGQIVEAVDHALAAKDLKLAVDQIERHAIPLVATSWMSTLLNLVRKLPGTALLDRPRMQMAIAWADTLTHRPQEAEVALWHVERVASTLAAVERQRLLDEADVVRACMCAYGDRIDGIEPLVANCLDRPQDFPPLAVGVAANVLSYYHLHRQQFGKVDPLQLWARDYHERSEGLFPSVYGRCFLGLAQYRAGSTGQARATYGEAIDLATRSSGPQSNSARLASALLGQLLYEANELEASERLIAESRFLGFEGGVVDFYLATFITGARLALLHCQREEATSLLQEGQETAATLKLRRLGAMIAFERVRLRVLEGDLRGAESLLADQLIDDGATQEVRIGLDLARARLLCARGRGAEAVELVQAQLIACEASGWKSQEIRARIVLALAQDAAGLVAAAEQSLLRAIDDGMSRDLIRLFLDEGQPLIAILERVRDKARRRPVGSEGLLEFNSAAQRVLVTSRDAREGAACFGAAPIRPAELFTARQTEVLRHLAQRRSNKEIARLLDVSVDTIKWYLKNIFIKLGVTHREQAIAEIARLRLLKEPE